MRNTSDRDTDSVAPYHLSCLVDLCQLHGVAPDIVFKSASTTPHRLIRDNQLVSWQQFSDLVSLAGKYFQDQDFRIIGQRCWQQYPLYDLGVTGRLMSSIHDQYLALFGELGYLQSQFPLSSHCLATDADELTIRVTMLPGRKTNTTFIDLLAGQMQALPQVLGSRLALVENFTEKGAEQGEESEAIVFQVRYQQQNQFRRWLRQTSTAIKGVQPLALSHNQLQHDYRYLDIEHQLLQTRTIHAEQAVEKLKQENQRFREATRTADTQDNEPPEISRGQLAIMNASLDGIILFNPKLEICSHNLRAAQIFGYNNLASLNINQLIPESLSPNPALALQQIDQQRLPITLHAIGLSKLKTLLTLTLSISRYDAHPDENNGQPKDSAELNVSRLKSQPQYICVVRDTRDQQQAANTQKKLTQQLRLAQKTDAIGQLVSGIAHDFNNLLIAITGYADLAEAAEAPVDRKQYLSEIKRAGEHGRHLTGRLLSFARQHSDYREIIDLREVTAEIQEMVSRLLPESIHVALDVGNEDIYLNADRTQIEQVLLNLCINARDAMPTGGTLSISVGRSEPVDNSDEQQRELAQIVVEDSGTGMTPSVATSIFDPLFTTKPPGQGTGLGLAVVAEIIEKHEGFIAVESEPGTGTRFSISLPTHNFVEPKKITGKRHPETDVQHGIETILIIEDDAQVRELAILILKAAGYRLLAAADGIEGQKTYISRHAEIDLVLLDVVMPRQAGQETAEQILSVNPEARIAFTTGYPIDSPQTRFLETSGIPVILKPYTVAGLRSQIRRLLDSPRDLADTGIRLDKHSTSDN